MRHLRHSGRILTGLLEQLSLVPDSQSSSLSGAAVKPQGDAQRSGHCNVFCVAVLGIMQCDCHASQKRWGYPGIL